MDTKLCEVCHDRLVDDPEWDLTCAECNRRADIAQDEEDRKRSLLHDDGPCDCQSCRGYPDNFVG